MALPLCLPSKKSSTKAAACVIQYRLSHPAAVAASIVLSLLPRSIPSQSVPLLPYGAEAAKLQSRSAVGRPQIPSSSSSPFSSFFPNSPAYFSSPASLFARSLLGERRGESGGRTERRRRERKCLLCKRWSEKQNGKEKQRLGGERTNERLVIKGRGAGEREIQRQVAPFFPFQNVDRL